MAQQSVSPEDLDAWLQSTEVTEEEPDSLEPLPVQIPKRLPKKKSWRRRSSLDDENISSRPCFGVDATALLAHESLAHVVKEDNRLQDEDSSSDTVLMSNASPDSFKKRRVSSPEDANDSPFDRQPSHGSMNSRETYQRLVTDDSALDDDARFHASQFAQMDAEARFSRRSSQFYTYNGNHNSEVKEGGIESHLRAMETSQRSHDMLQSHRIEQRIIEGREAMRECGESRRLLVRISRRNMVRSMTDDSRKAPDQDRVTMELRRMEGMLRKEQDQLARIRSEFVA